MQSDVNIGTSNSDLAVIYGMYNLCKEREEARSSFRYIASDMNNINRFYFRLGFHLHECQVNKYYEDFGYTDFSEFVAANFGLDKSALSRCINVFMEFNAANDVSYCNGVETRGCAMNISDSYKEYSYSQLCEMVSMDKEKRKLVGSNMTIREIRELKKTPSVSADKICAFFDGLKRFVKPFTRENVLNYMVKCGRSYSSASGGSMGDYSFTPGKLRLSRDDFTAYPFNTWLDLYGDFETVESCDVATNLWDKSGIVQQNFVKSLGSLDVKHISIFDASGKVLLKLLTCDIVENDDNECIFRVCSDTPGNVDIVKKYFLGNS